MKENFNQLYRKLYMQNYNDLEPLRNHTNMLKLVSLVGICLIVMMLYVLPILSLIIFVGLVIFWVVMLFKGKPVSKYGVEKTYKQLFKEKIVKPVVETYFESATYDPNRGMDRIDYIKAQYKGRIDSYESEDLITMPIQTKAKKIESIITIAEVHTKKLVNNKKGPDTLETNFLGLAANFKIPKSIDKNFHIRENGRIWNEHRVKMDVGEFEKVFDVDCSDKILAMRILTADVMQQILELYQKYRYELDVSIIRDVVHIRINTTSVFEPLMYGKPLLYKNFEKYQVRIEAIMKLAICIYETIMDLDI